MFHLLLLLKITSYTLWLKECEYIAGKCASQLNAVLMSNHPVDINAFYEGVREGAPVHAYKSNLVSSVIDQPRYSSHSGISEKPRREY